MKTTEVNDSLIGKRCKCIFTGLMVTGTIEDIKISEHTAEVKVQYDEPHQWGTQLYEDGWAFARLSDDFGSLRHLEIIDDKYQTLRVSFSKAIMEINQMFAQSYNTWGVVNLKEWIDSYESSRFTQINEITAIITSEYNIEHILEWLTQNMPLDTYEIIYK
ncbi:DUF7258 domain-containing protein [Massilibacteroides vaginae]|uniref:DUF7258 domain-containing protein n=1 Tax=Massilibacteroides vaginae TaxID=1673718 RepID=UPI000A1CC2C4|nr:hypothetical protein [Massilibacteroides vaginae]